METAEINPQSDFNHKNILVIGGVAVFLLFALFLHNKSSVDDKNNVAEVLNSGKVLGASTYGDQLYKYIDGMKIKTINDETPTGLARYAAQVKIVLTNNGYSDFTSDPVVVEKVVSDIQNISAPSYLKDYHKLMLAYNVMIAERMKGNQDPDIDILLPAVNEQLKAFRTQAEQSYQIELP